MLRNVSVIWDTASDKDLFLANVPLETHSQNLLDSRWSYCTNAGALNVKPHHPVRPQFRILLPNLAYPTIPIVLISDMRGIGGKY
jgi:hypothetical protein